MGNVFLHGKGGGGGSGGFELTIVGGTTRPAKPSQNMIWVNTDVEITDYILAASDPDPAEPVEHMVWISIGNSGAIKVPSPVGDDWITVYPLSAKQLIDGVWVDKITKSYQDGEWVDWAKLVLIEPDAIELYNGATYTVNGNSITVKHSGTNGTAAYFGYKADLTDVKTVRVHFTKRTHKAETGFVSKSGVGILRSSQTSGVMQFWNGTFLAQTINSTNGESYVDVSVESLSGELYIWVGCYGISYDENELEFDSIELLE